MKTPIENKVFKEFKSLSYKESKPVFVKYKEKYNK